MLLRTMAFVFLLALLPSHARSEERIALLIGNHGYNAKVGPLTNPHKDIALIGAALEKLGFKTTLIKDVEYRRIVAEIKKHISTVRQQGPGAISFVYYSGHGAADPDTKINYLIPVDVANADDEELWNYSLNLNIVSGRVKLRLSRRVNYFLAFVRDHEPKRERARRNGFDEDHRSAEQFPVQGGCWRREQVARDQDQ